MFSFLIWIPRRCHYNPANPPTFTIALNLLFASVATITIANQYYSHPILNKLAEDFDVSYEKVSRIPALMQAGYAVGLFCLCPLGDLLKRRMFVLLMVFITASLWIGLCITKSFSVFCVFSFLTSVTSVTPQLLIPLVGGLAPPHRRATALSIVVSGLLLGTLLARFVSGVITQYAGWRHVYWFSLGLQYIILVLLWLFMPDYPSANPNGLNYFKLLWSILNLVTHEPLLVQACLVGFLTFAIFTSFWTTLTFLLASDPYDYSSLVIGLFAFIGIAGMCFGPAFARYVTDQYATLFSIIIAELVCLAGVAIGTYIGTFTVAGPVIQAFAIDFGLQVSQIAQRSAIYAIAPSASNRINTAYMVSLCCGQLMGTSAGNHLYARGGWKTSGNANLAFAGAALVICFARAPWETGWIGWRGGWSVRKRVLMENGVDEERRTDCARVGHRP